MKQEQASYRTPLPYIAGRKRIETTATRQKTNKRTRNYCTSSLASPAPHVELAKVRASPGAIECFRSPLEPPVPHAHVICSSHPILSILDNNSEFDPLPSFAFARDRPKGLEIFMEAIHPRRCRSTSSLGPLHRQPPKHNSL